MKLIKDFLLSYRKNVVLYTAMVVALVFVLISFLVYTVVSGTEIRNTNHQYLINNTKQSAKSVEEVIESGKLSIGVLSGLVSESLTSPEVDVADFQKLINGTIFDFLEFADKNGVNHNVTGGTSDATDREYYIEAMKGNSGTTIVFNSRATHENLLSFYAPVYYDGEIIGSLIGVYQATNRVSEFLEIDYFGEISTTYLCTSDGRIFAGSKDFDPTSEVYIYDVCGEENVSKIKEAVEKKKEVEFLNDGNKSTGYMMPLSNREWFLVQIYPADVNVAMMSRMNAIAWMLVCVILIIFLAHQLVVYRHNRDQEKRIQDQIDILQSMADIYYSMHLIDLRDFSLTDYAVNASVKEIMDKGVNAIDQMHYVIKGTISDEYLDIALEFTEVATVAERMKGKKFMFMDFLGNHIGWVRMQYVKIEEDENGNVIKVMFTVQAIDKEKRRELELIYKSNNDELTALYNRRAYDDDTRTILSDPNSDNLVVVSIDVNGLKGINDTLGHNAGDELIIGAAKCLDSTLGRYGNIYRVGGDEFMAILYADAESLEKAKAELDEMVSKWKGTMVDHLAMSCGYVAYRDHKDLSFHEMEKLADKLMYEVKSEYYVKNNIDRRRR